MELELAQAQFRCVKVATAPYLKSKTKAIKHTAKSLNAAAQFLETWAVELHTLLQRVLDGKVVDSKVPAESARLGAFRENASELLPMAANELLFAFSPGARGKLVLTTNQRARLMENLVKMVGPGVQDNKFREGVNVGENYPIAAGGLIYNFLANPEWISADSTATDAGAGSAP